MSVIIAMVMMVAMCAQALPVGASAGRIKSAVLYSSKSGTIDEATAEYIRKNKVDTAVIVGGASAVGANAETELGELVVETVRIYGDNRNVH